MPRASYFNMGQVPPNLIGENDCYCDAKTRQAWERFVTSEDERGTPETNIRDVISKSWKRSASAGVDAAQLATRKLAEHDYVYRRQQLNEQMRKAARQAFARLAPYLKNAKTILILADDMGVIIDAIGDQSVLESGQEIHLEVGGIWAESAIGTNGIGTALQTGKPTYVHGAEHFVEGVQNWTCAGAPIRDPIDRSVIGVVNLSGPPQIFREHNLALVIAASREIEIALAERQRRERTQLLEAFLLSEFSQARDRVILLDKTGRIQFHRESDEKRFTPAQNLTIGKRLLPDNLEFEQLDFAKLEVGQFLPPEMEMRGLERLNLEGAYKGSVLFLKGKEGNRVARRQHRNIAARTGIAEDDLVIVGESPTMLDAMDLAERAAAANVSVLIQGETGVGKELFARLIHNKIAKQDAPYITLNCAAIGGDLIGAELFGYVEGAFTGAIRGGRPGKIELANGGVLCLDEVGDMPIEMQPYLLRVLEQRAVYRIGDNKRRPIDMRLVGMTNRDLRTEIENGKFRRDLFYRIGVVTIDVPPLRERGNDIALLIEHFSQRLADETDCPALRFSDDAIAFLRRHRWPGNVRELRNLIQRLVLMSRDGLVTVEDLPPEIRAVAPIKNEADNSIDKILSGDAGDLESIEANAIRRALVAEKDNLTKVAAVLGISRPTLYRKLRRYGIAR
ncbi:sigma-54-dependent Fis family transcriptional regulator [Marivita sp.]|uniref:sigma-54-dependent Fis family transcriptional regulator n=1 Tax=Marivita sp. TaxID=2003365 RepID=UPI00261176BF|nr:sigma-54-dependent Fis family transcriptional regulator [Marivita sp.]